MARRKVKFVKERPPDQHGVDVDWRLFLAIPMPESVKSLVARLIAAMTPHDLPVRWVGSESAHLTLHFLGETPPERAQLLRLGLSSTVAKQATFTLSTADVGVFPSLAAPRVLWLGLKGQTNELHALQRGLGRQLGALDFEIDDRAMHPHITLGRVRDDPPKNIGARVQTVLNEPEVLRLVREERAELDVSEVMLIRSFLERGGPRHEPIARYVLGKDKGPDQR
jgi:2'-5' RNA ligase